MFAEYVKVEIVEAEHQMLREWAHDLISGQDWHEQFINDSSRSGLTALEKEAAVYEGMLGKYAFSKWSHVPWGWKHFLDRRNTGYDMVWQDKTIDVRTRKDDYQGFAESHTSRFHADIGVCAHIIPGSSDINLVGWFDRLLWEHGSHQDDFGSGPIGVIEINWLKPMYKLEPALMKVAANE